MFIIFILFLSYIFIFPYYFIDYLVYILINFIVPFINHIYYSRNMTKRVEIKVNNINYEIDCDFLGFPNDTGPIVHVDKDIIDRLNTIIENMNTEKIFTNNYINLTDTNKQYTDLSDYNSILNDNNDSDKTESDTNSDDDIEIVE